MNSHTEAEQPVDDNRRFEWIDRAYQAYLEANPTMKERWLLAQTIYTGHTRRSLLPVLPVQHGQRVLDIGAGFGAMTFDLGTYQSLRIEAIDLDEHALSVARSIHNQLQLVGAFPPDTHITFKEADIEQLPYENATFDFIIGRFVYQHLPDPKSATSELARVVKSGGHVCIIDIDDQLVLTYPEHSDAFARLQRAFIELQHLRGGDRYVGRKLPHFLREGGFEVLASVIQPESQFAQVDKHDLGYQLMHARLREVRDEMVQRGILTLDEFEQSMEDMEQDTNQFQFHANGTMVVLARKPLS